MKKTLLISILFVAFHNGKAQTGIGTVAPVNKFQVETSAAAPSTSGTSSNGNLRLGVTGANQVLDFGLGTTYGWLQARDKTSYATNYILALNPNGGNVGIGIVNPTVKLHVNGDIIANSIAGNSDQRFKINIRTIDHALNKVKSLRGVYFNWNQTAFPERDFGAQNELGFIAQEVEKISPELVSKDNSPAEYRSVKYDKVVALLVEAIKEQQKQIDQLKNEVKRLKRKKR